MYKVTTYRLRVKLWGFGPGRAVELEQYINDFSKDGWLLVNVMPFGLWVMCIWKKN